MKNLVKITVATILVQGLAAPVQATPWTFDVHFTRHTPVSGSNVGVAKFSYDDTNASSFTHVGTTNIGLAPGADGIIFAPNGNLLIGGQGHNNIYEMNPTTGAIVDSEAVGSAAFHLTMDPTNSNVYTSAFGGALKKVAIDGGGGLGSFVSSTSISGSETGVTQIAFAPNGNVFYVQGNPNGFGNLGYITVATGSTSRFLTSVESAHGLVYDPFTGKMTTFGAGKIGRFDTSGTNAAIAASFAQTPFDITCDFDQGGVDGQGHAFIAGCGQITFIDYRATGDITSALNVIKITNGFTNIDDVAPLSGAGAQNGVPAPGALALLGLGLLGLGATRRRLG